MLIVYKVNPHECMIIDSFGISCSMASHESVYTVNDYIYRVSCMLPVSVYWRTECYSTPNTG